MSNLNITPAEISKIFINAIPSEDHHRVVEEFYNLDVIVDFTETITYLIKWKAMDVFNISKEMQEILIFASSQKMLDKITEIRQSFQREYEARHNKTVVVVQSGSDENVFVSELISYVHDTFKGAHAIFQTIGEKGITVNFKGQSIKL